MSDDDDDNLICPITQEYFRDPVLAEDGRLYEREAITRWINEHGTSPFTRQVLDVNHLQPDDEVRRRADRQRRRQRRRRRNLSVSYNRASDQVQLPPIRPPSNSSLNTITVDIRHPPEPTDPYSCHENIEYPNMRSSRGNVCSKCCVRNHSNLFACICVIFCICLPIMIANILLATPSPRRSSTTRQYTTRSPLCNPFNYGT